MLRSDTILALDIGASSLKLGCFAPQKGGSLELIRYAVRDLNADPANEEHRLTDIQLGLQDMMAELGIPAGRPVLISVPGQQVFSRFVKLPPVSKDKILQMVQYEAQQNVPFPINEVVWDYQLIGSGVGEVDVMLAAMKAEIIEQLIDAIRKAGLHPELVDVAPMAIYNAVRYNYASLPKCTLVIDIGARSTDLIFIEENRVFNRSIPVGGNTITQQIMREFELSYEDAEKLKKTHAFVAFGGAYEAPASQVADKVSKTVRTIMTRLHTEITRSINFYRTQQSGGEPGLALLTGGTSIIAYTDTFLKEKLHIDVDYMNPFANVSVSSTIDAGDIGAKAHLMGEVVGLALRRSLGCPIELNLLPPKYVKDETFQRRQPMLVVSMIGVLALLGLWAADFYRLSRLGRERLSALQSRVSQLRDVETRLAEKEAKIGEMEGQTKTLASLPPRRTAWLQVVSDIRTRLADGMWLVRFNTLRVGEVAEGAPSAGSAPGAPLNFATFSPSAAAPAEAAPAETGAGATPPGSFEAIEISGFAYKDKVQQQDIIKFRDALRESPLFDAKTDIVAVPMGAGDDFVHEFTIRIVLKTPLVL
ncbi:MAG: type IV pilus assembly protein PilM [Lentisphaerae bacterium]|nr:type IV pilus assembly protein PilM [Lentisphaerota bacterium]